MWLVAFSIIYVWHVGTIFNAEGALSSDLLATVHSPPDTVLFCQVQKTLSRISLVRMFPPSWGAATMKRANWNSAGNANRARLKSVWTEFKRHTRALRFECDINIILHHWHRCFFPWPPRSYPCTNSYWNRVILVCQWPPCTNSWRFPFSLIVHIMLIFYPVCLGVKWYDKIERNKSERFSGMIYFHIAKYRGRQNTNRDICRRRRPRQHCFTPGRYLCMNPPPTNLVKS